MKNIRSYFYPFLLLCVFGSVDVNGQVVALYDVIYRPPGVSYSVLSDGKHEVIFQDGSRQQAAEILWTIQQTKSATNSLVGSTSDFSLSVVLNDYSDTGNGFVTPFPFKSEIESVALRGRGLSRRHPSWTQLVTTHELVHAAQSDFHRNKSLVGLIRAFAPDFARSINLFYPPGFSEGLAVYRESEVTPGAGRLNHPFFLMQARAGLNSKNGWTLAQMLEVPEFTRPFDRFYKGGSLFADFFLEVYGYRGVERLFKWQQHVPFLGFGANLFYATGTRPRYVRRDFESWYRAREDSLVSSLGELTTSTVVLERKGLISRKPQWLSDSKILVYGLGYNQSRGFQIVDLNGNTKRLSRNAISDDAVFQVSQDMSEVLYSRYSEHLSSSVSVTVHSYVLNIESGKEKRIAGSDHTYNPVKLASGRVLALKSDGQYNAIVELTAGSGTTVRLSFEQSDFVSLIPRPGSDSLAVILNIAGHQAIFLIDTSRNVFELRPWIGFENSTIYDGSWSRSGRYFSFTSDRTGLLNSYVLDASEERLWQVTNVLYGAMEAQMSPSGRQIVFVEYGDQRFDLKIMPFDRESHLEIDRDEANHTSTRNWSDVLNTAPRFLDEMDAFEVKPYRTRTRMKPRMAYPTLYIDNNKQTDENDAHLGLGVGIAMQGSDPLGKLTFHSEGIIQKNRLWGEVGIKSGHFSFRPDLTIQRRPQTVIALVRTRDGSTHERRVIRDRTSMEAGVFRPFVLDQNVHRTSMITSLRLSYRSDVFVNDSFQKLQSRTKSLSLLPSAFFGYRLVKNPRDLLPTSGYSLSWFGEWDLVTDATKNKRGWILMGNAYLPWLHRTNTGIKINAGLLVQNSSSIFALDFFKPKGWENAFLNDDVFVRYGLRIVQPVLFPDNGFILIPAFFRAVYLYGFAEHLHRASDFGDNVSSVGGGIGLKFRLFYNFDLDLAVGAAYRMDDKTWQSHTDLREN